MGDLVKKARGGGGEFDTTSAADIMFSSYLGESPSSSSSSTTSSFPRPNFLDHPDFVSRVLSEHLLVSAGINSNKYEHHLAALSVAMAGVNERAQSVAGWERVACCYEVMEDWEGREWAKGMAQSCGRDDGGTYRTVGS